MLLYMFNGQVGIVNYVFKQCGIIDEFKTWLGDGNLAIWVITIGNAWYQFPFHMMTILAGLQTIPEDLIDAAEVDGAGPFRRFRYITLPCLRNIIVMSTSLMVIFSFKAFALIWTATQGGPFYTTSIFEVYTYQLAFQEFNMGYAATVGAVSLLFLAVFAFIYIKTVQREIGI
jgi:multiple sugar transport system permease protein